MVSKKVDSGRLPEHVFTATFRDGSQKTIGVRCQCRREAFRQLYDYCMNTEKGFLLQARAVTIR